MRRRALLRSFGTAATVGFAGLSGGAGGEPADIGRATTSPTAGGQQPADDHTVRRLAVPLAGRTRSFRLSVPRPLYEYFADRPRDDDYLTYATDGANERVVAPVADAVVDLASAAPTSAAVRRAATGLVQHLSYVPDAEIAAGEYPKYPVETLVDRAGDCEDTAALLAALLAHLGRDIALLALWDADHMAVGVAAEGAAAGTPYVADGRTYQYQETVEPGWALGDVPSNYAGVDADVLPLDSQARA